MKRETVHWQPQPLCLEASKISVELSKINECRITAFSIKLGQARGEADVYNLFQYIKIYERLQLLVKRDKNNLQVLYKTQWVTGRLEFC